MLLKLLLYFATIRFTIGPSPSANVAGYKLYFCTSQTTCPQVLDRGMVLTYDYVDLPASVVRVYATAYNSLQRESAASVSIDGNPPQAPSRVDAQ